MAAENSRIASLAALADGGDYHVVVDPIECPILALDPLADSVHILELLGHGVLLCPAEAGRWVGLGGEFVVPAPPHGQRLAVNGPISSGPRPALQQQGSTQAPAPASLSDLRYAE